MKKNIYFIFTFIGLSVFSLKAQEKVVEKANKEYKWLVTNAPKFDFCQVYTEKEEGKRRTGYNEEKWHWSYMPLAHEYLKLYQEIVSYENISGFSGSQFAKELDVINKYVLGISDTFS